LKAKKYALVQLYKVWSAFSKGLRHAFIAKQQAVYIPKIGMFFNRQKRSEKSLETSPRVKEGEPKSATPDMEIESVFCASNELQRLLSFDEDESKVYSASSI
jgi:hypothetical protein